MLFFKNLAVVRIWIRGFLSARMPKLNLLSNGDTLKFKLNLFHSGRFNGNYLENHLIKFTVLAKIFISGRFLIDKIQLLHMKREHTLHNIKCARHKCSF